MGEILSSLILNLISDALPEWLPLWGLAIIIIFLWGLLLWGIRKFLIYQKIRRDAVIISAFQVLFLAGTIFILNILLVPVVLFAFRGMAFYSLLACMLAAILYLIKVDDREVSDNQF
jgi:hypothetical protein